MEELGKIKKGSGVNNVSRPSFGDDPMLNDSMSAAGLRYGLKRVIALGSYVISPAIANLSSNRLRITGSSNYQMNGLIIQSTNT